jgi:hypothetical protein
VAAFTSCDWFVLYNMMRALLAMLLMMPALALAQVGEDEQVQAKIVVGSDSIEPGQKVLVGIEFQMQPDWHIYWKNPGDSGMATSVEWRLPEGFEVQAAPWPVPVIFDTQGALSFGYENMVTLLYELQVPEFIESETVKLAAEVRWLACKDICIPGNAEPVAQVDVDTPSRQGGLTTLWSDLPVVRRVEPTALEETDTHLEIRFENREDLNTESWPHGFRLFVVQTNLAASNPARHRYEDGVILLEKSQYFNGIPELLSVLVVPKRPQVVIASQETDPPAPKLLHFRWNGAQNSDD